MKVSLEPFQKGMVACECCCTFECQRRHPMLNFCEIQHPKVNRQSPESRPQARNYLGVSFDSFLCASGVKEKNGIGFLNLTLKFIGEDYIEKIQSVLSLSK